MDDESFRQLYQSAHRSTSLVGSGGRGKNKRAVPARLSDARDISHVTSADDWVLRRGRDFLKGDEVRDIA